MNRQIKTVCPYCGVGCGVIAEADEGNRIGSAVGEDTIAVMLENHGVLVIGRDVPEAWTRLYFLERACQVQVLAHSTGRTIIPVAEDIARHTGDEFVRNHDAAVKLFASVRRRLDRECPGYAA